MRGADWKRNAIAQTKLYEMSKRLRKIEKRNWKFGMSYELEVIEIQNYLPHRYPFLLVDRVKEFEPTRKLLS